MLLVLLLYSTLRGNCGWLGPVIRSFNTSTKEVWLTIDDGPHPGETELILDLLKSFNAKATFFLVGDRVHACPELTRTILEAGHSVGNHSASHPSGMFWGLLPKAASWQIEEGARAIWEITGRVPVLFRAPVGMANIFVHRALYDRRMYLVGWTTRGFDTGRRTPAKIAERVLRHVLPGGILLLHEGHHASSNPATRLAALRLVLEGLKVRGYKCVIPSLHWMRLTGAPALYPKPWALGRNMVLPNPSNSALLGEENPH
jgi:peptidoglycan/xylan/chitin deacetylase (PgdA/CDA1 family)